jgi:single-strand DNA-binding protein
MTTTITAEGNLTAEPDLRFTKITGNAVCTCRLAVSSRRKNMDGEYVDTPTVFYEATVWGALAEHVADSLHKGDRVLVYGTTYDEEWTDREGNTRSKHVLQVNALGASLRYATVTTHRPARDNADAVEQRADAQVIELT